MRRISLASQSGFLSLSSSSSLLETLWALVKNKLLGDEAVQSKHPQKLPTLRICLREFSSPRNYGAHSRGIHSYMTTASVNQETMRRQRQKERWFTLERSQPSFPVFCFSLVILVCLLTPPWTPALQHKEVIGRKRVWISEKKRQSFNSSEAKRWGQCKVKTQEAELGNRTYGRVWQGYGVGRETRTSLGAPKDRVRGFKHRSEAKQAVSSILLGLPLDGLQSTMLQPNRTY